MQTTEDVIKIYTDGACSGNPGPGGWSAILLYKKHEKILSGFLELTTNNQMELMAICCGLEAVKGKNIPIELYSDSEYAINGATIWKNGWLRSNWKKGKIKNIDLWQRIYQASEGLNISWIWIRGHSGNFYNEKADMLARGQIKRN